LSLYVGVSGARRNACVGVVVDGRLAAACEQERLTRVRGVCLPRGREPKEALDETLRLTQRSRADVSACVVAEDGVAVESSWPVVRVEHHLAHAATAFLTSTLTRAAVLVCDTNVDRELSVWLGAGGRLVDQSWRWSGSGFASLYSACAELFEPTSAQAPRTLESLAHLGHGHAVEDMTGLFRYTGEGIVCAADWRARVHGMIQAESRLREHPSETAAALQRRLGELLLELLEDVRTAVDADALCLGGGLFYNTYLTTLVRRSGIFREVSVPINPGNAGLAVGAPLLVARQSGAPVVGDTVSPFLGPEYDAEAIKAELDGCKLSYLYGTENEAMDAAVSALRRGQLVAWFQGRMEWGHRALGHRSILANPRSPYVLDNLNSFLRKRARWRSFGVSVCESAAADLFCGPATSRYMEYQYGLRERDGLQHTLPPGAKTLRVQTVAPDGSAFHALHRRMEDATGLGVLVNTSFNGFHEPIACTPRDAIRVFYGSGVDVLVMDRFILRK
jgi:carbamoyltransferase